MTSLDDWLTLAEAAEIVEADPSSLAYAIRRGDLKATKKSRLRGMGEQRGDAQARTGAGTEDPAEA